MAKKENAGAARETDSRVFVARAPSYETPFLARALEAVVEAAGGWDAAAPPGRPVLVKPNLMSAREPARAVTTHPAFVAALARALLARGRAVTIGDSPAGAFRGLAAVWEKTGVAAVAAELGVPLVSFEAGGSISRPVASRFVREIRVARACADAAVVNAPKLKTHFLTLFTGAVKNLLGQVPGLAKAELHRVATHPDDFAELLVDLVPALAPSFTLVDAVVGLEGDGPASGTPRPFGLVVGGFNPAAVDVVLARVLGFKAGEAPTVRISVERGVTAAEPEVVVVDGGAADLAAEGVALPGSLWLRRMPRPVLRLASRQFIIQPTVRAAACIGCRRCVDSCPVGAAEMAGDVARIAAARCIQCLCCYETCADEAIYLKPSRLARWYYALRDYNRRRRARRAAA